MESIITLIFIAIIIYIIWRLSKVKNHSYNLQDDKIIFTPKWKEIMVCEYKDHNFILEFPMGIPTLCLPQENEWNFIAPEWAKEIYPKLEKEAMEWCKNNKVNFLKEEGHYYSFDDIEYMILRKDGKGTTIGYNSYIIKTSDGKHEIFLKQEKEEPSLKEREQKIFIDNNQLSEKFTGNYIINDFSCENIFFGCINKANEKKNSNL